MISSLARLLRTISCPQPDSMVPRRGLIQTRISLMEKDLSPFRHLDFDQAPRSDGILMFSL